MNRRRNARERVRTLLSPAAAERMFPASRGGGNDELEKLDIDSLINVLRRADVNPSLISKRLGQYVTGRIWKCFEHMTRFVGEFEEIYHRPTTSDNVRSRIIRAHERMLLEIVSSAEVGQNNTPFFRHPLETCEELERTYYEDILEYAMSPYEREQITSNVNTMLGNSDLTLASFTMFVYDKSFVIDVDSVGIIDVSHVNIGRDDFDEEEESEEGVLRSDQYMTARVAFHPSHISDAFFTGTYIKRTVEEYLFHLLPDLKQHGNPASKRIRTRASAVII